MTSRQSLGVGGFCAHSYWPRVFPRWMFRAVLGSYGRWEPLTNLRMNSSQKESIIQIPQRTPYLPSARVTLPKIGMLISRAQPAEGPDPVRIRLRSSSIFQIRPRMCSH